MNFKRLSDIDVKGKRVFIRADLNVPQDDAGNITDDTRIRASLPAIQDALIGGAAVMAAAVLVAAGFAGLVVRPRLGRAGMWCVACLVAFVAWQGASIIWSVLPDNSWDYLNRSLAYLSFLVLGLFVAAIGASESAGLTSPSVGRPRCEVTITAAPAFSASSMQGTEARTRVSSVMLPASSCGTLRSARMKTRWPRALPWSQRSEKRRTFIADRLEENRRF
jgi:hypothetical protein